MHGCGQREACERLHQSTPKTSGAGCSQRHFPAERAVLLPKTRRDREAVLGFPPTAPLPRPLCSVGKLKRKEDKFSYAHLHRLIPGVRQSSLPPTHHCCCAALEPLHSCTLRAAGWRTLHKPALIALTSTCQREGDGQSPWGTSQGHAGTGVFSTGVLNCGCSQPFAGPGPHSPPAGAARPGPHGLGCRGSPLPARPTTSRGGKGPRLLLPCLATRLMPCGASPPPLCLTRSSPPNTWGVFAQHHDHH